MPFNRSGQRSLLPPPALVLATLFTPLRFPPDPSLPGRPRCSRETVMVLIGHFHFGFAGVLSVKRVTGMTIFHQNNFQVA